VLAVISGYYIRMGMTLSDDPEHQERGLHNIFDHLPDLDKKRDPSPGGDRSN
jgi:hypothetical protein